MVYVKYLRATPIAFISKHAFHRKSLHTMSERNPELVAILQKSQENLDTGHQGPVFLSLYKIRIVYIYAGACREID